MRNSCHRLAAGLLLAAACGTAAAQSFTENFNDITTLAGSGWATQNASVAVGSTGWFQGRPTSVGGPFDAFNGAANAYIGADYNNTGSTGTISNWLMTPNRVFRNGDVLTFYTRKASPDTYADRLEVRLSTNGASTNVGNGGGVGDYTTLLLSINPNLVLGVYPTAWTQYTITVSGLPAPTSGRMAFRYFVTSAGLNGTNSDYIGIDAVGYTPYVCPTVTVSPSTVGGATFGQAYSTTLGQTGALGTPNFAMTAGALPPGLLLSAAGSISGTPTATGTFNFTVTVSDASGCSGSRAYSIAVAPSVPGAPGNVAASAGDAQAQVSWDAPLSDGGAGIIGYTATCTDGATNFTAVATNSPVDVTGLVNGTDYTCTVTATNGIGTGPASAPSNSVTPKGNQTITFGAQSDKVYSPGGGFMLDPLASASSGLEVEYDSTTPGVCTIAGAVVSIVAAGECTITADQPGAAAWNPAPQEQQSFQIAQSPQLLVFPPQTVASRLFETPGGTFAIDPLAQSSQPTSGEPIVYSSLDTLVCTVAGTTVTIVGEGTCVIAADLAGNANFLAAQQETSQVELVIPTEADLSVVVTAETPFAMIGETVAYSITVANAGPATASNVLVQDAVPARLAPASLVWECVEATGTTCTVPASDEGDLDIGIASLPPGTSVRFEVMGEVIPAEDPADDFTAFDYSVTVSLPQGSALTDPPGNNTDSASVQVRAFPIFEDGFEAQ